MSPHSPSSSVFSNAAFERLEDRAVGVVLHAVSPEEEAQFVADVRDCDPETKEYVYEVIRNTRHVLENLSVGLQAQPPHRLKQATMSAVNADSAYRSLNDAGPVSTGPAPTVTMPGSPVAHEPVNGDFHKRSSWFSQSKKKFTALAGAAALVLIAAGVGIGVLIAPVMPSSPGALSPLAAEKRPVQKLILADDIAVVGQPVGSSGQATVAWSRSANSAMFMMANVSPPPEGSEYRIWFAPDGSAPKLRAAMAPKDVRAFTSALIGDLDDAEQLLLTVETVDQPAQVAPESPPADSVIATFDLR